MAVVIPAHGHPSLLPEAVYSALGQQTGFSYRIVLVNDGCPYPETETLCATYARARPETVLHLHRRQGGPSAARNEGVRVALAAWPSIEAVSFLDADDRLWPSFLQAGLDALDADRGAGWVFPDLALFGRHSTLLDMSGPYSVLEHLGDNYCAASSLVRREVFEAGVWFDEDLRHGYEDWEFWLQAVEAGFRGRHLPGPPYRYRSRWESRNRGAGREKAAIFAMVHAKHPALFTLRRFAALEWRERPRYAVYLADERRVLLTGDPAEDGVPLAVTPFADRLWAGGARRGADPAPPIVVVTRRPVLDVLRRVGSARSAFWWLQVAAQLVDVATLAVEAGRDTSLRYDWMNAPREEPEPSGAVAVRTAVLLQALEERDLARLASARVAEGRERRERLALSGPDLDLPAMPPARDDLLELGRRVREAWRGHPAAGWSTQPSAPRRILGDGLTLARSVFGVEAPLPLARRVGGPHVAFALERTDGSDLNRLVVGLGRESRDQGFVPHLFVLSDAEARLPASAGGWFDSVCVLPVLAAPSPEDLVSLLGAMDAVVAAQARPVYDALGRLRRLGVRTILLVGPSDPARPPYLADPAFEAQHLEDALDGVATFSRRLLARCRAFGVPESKLAYLPPAPGEAAATAMAAAAPAVKSAPGGPLRLLFLGPPSRAETADLASRIRAVARERGQPLDWRWPPDPFTDAERARDFAWADVLCVAPGCPSPRTSVAEAQSFGCVFIAPALEPLGEMAEEGATGFLFPQGLDGPTLAAHVCDHLSRLAADPAALSAMQERARELASLRTWPGSFAPLGRLLLATGAGL